MPTALTPIKTTGEIVPYSNAGANGVNYVMIGTAGAQTDGISISQLSLILSGDCCGAPEFCPGCITYAIHQFASNGAAATDASDLFPWTGTSEDLTVARTANANFTYLGTWQFAIHQQTAKASFQPAEGASFNHFACFAQVHNLTQTCLSNMAATDRELIYYVIIADNYVNLEHSTGLGYNAVLTQAYGA